MLNFGGVQYCCCFCHGKPTGLIGGKKEMSSIHHDRNTHGSLQRGDSFPGFDAPAAPGLKWCEMCPNFHD